MAALNEAVRRGMLTYFRSRRRDESSSEEKAHEVRKRPKFEEAGDKDEGKVGRASLFATGPVYVAPEIKRIYRMIDKKSYLDWGLTSDWTPTGSRTKRKTRARSGDMATDQKSLKTSKSKEKSARDGSSEGYGEMTEGSIERLIKLLSSFDGAEEECRLTSSSSFIDIGSGYGKVVLHVGLGSVVKKADGVEYVESRHKKAALVLRELREGRLPQLGSTLASRLERIDVRLGDATKLRSLSHSHIYIYDKVFSPQTMEALVPLLEASDFRVLVTYQRPELWRRLGLTCCSVSKVITMRTTGGQNFKAYVMTRD